MNFYIYKGINIRLQEKLDHSILVALINGYFNGKKTL